MSTEYTWSKPYCDLSHYGSVHDFRRATIQIFPNVVILSKWYKGCGFSPEQVRFDTIEEAKKAGETWTHKGS